MLVIQPITQHKNNDTVFENIFFLHYQLNLMLENVPALGAGGCESGQTKESTPLIPSIQTIEVRERKKKKNNIETMCYISFFIIFLQLTSSTIHLDDQIQSAGYTLVISHSYFFLNFILKRFVINWDTYDRFILIQNSQLFHFYYI